MIMKELMLITLHSRNHLPTIKKGEPNYDRDYVCWLHYLSIHVTCISSLFREIRCGKAGLGEEAEEEVKREKGLMRGKCIPRKKKSCSKQGKK